MSGRIAHGTLVDAELRPFPADPLALRQVYGCHPSGVTAVCALDRGRPRGLTASSFTSVSLDPPLVSICVQHTSTTWPLLRRQARLGVSVLAESQETVARALALRTLDRFTDIEWARTEEGAVLIAGACAALDCSLDAEVPAGDHLIALLRVHRLSTAPARPPLVFHGSRFRRLHPAEPPWN